MTSEFKSLQENVCIEQEKPPDISKFCKTCEPDPNHIAPNWWDTKQPFLNKKTCEYSTIVTMNENGDVHTHSTISKSGLSFDNLLKTYIKNGIKPWEK